MIESVDCAPYRSQLRYCRIAVDLDGDGSKKMRTRLAMATFILAVAGCGQPPDDDNARFATLFRGAGQGGAGYS